tara:strand:- start:1625 stop:1882 length:258 start_codon:yes stop_codon:yes gene_type:complete
MEIAIIIVLVIMAILGVKLNSNKIDSEIDLFKLDMSDVVEDVKETQDRVVIHEGDIETLKHLMKDVRHNLNRLDKKVKKLTKDEK